MVERFYNTELSTDLTAIAKGGVFALGNFDGVHRGHQSVIKTALDQARRLGGLATRAITLEPHPRTILKPDVAPFRLTPARVKIELLQHFGLDEVMVINFTPEFSQLEAQDFVKKILIERHGVQHIVAGFDFVFGHKRGGNMQKLREWLAPYGVGVTEVTPFRDGHGEIMSSSRTRDALQLGDLATAQHILGRPWSISGVVERGEQRGRTIGFPTANINVQDYLRPKFGVYAVLAKQAGSHQIFPGVCNIGLRPTVGGQTDKLEFHLFDFFAEIYGQEWSVELIEFIRPEQSFADLTSLQTQIKQDVEKARAILTRTSI